MKYLCMVFFDERKLFALSEEDGRALISESIDHATTLTESGRLLAGEPLQTVNSAITIRFRDGEKTVTDGPFAETNEQIGGFILIEAEDLNQAIQIASGIPPARLGGVEVRPIMEAPSLHANS